MMPRTTPLLLLALCACQVPGLMNRTSEARLSAGIESGNVVLTWNPKLVASGTARLVPVRVHPDRADEEGAPYRVRGSSLETPTSELEPGTWRFRLQVTGANGDLIVDELSPAVEVEAPYPEVCFLQPSDLGLERTFSIPTLVAVPRWDGLQDEIAGFDVQAAHDELMRAARACVESSIGPTYVTDVAGLRTVENARDALAPRGGKSDLLSHALTARAVLVFDLRLPVGDVPAQLSLRVFDVTYRRYDQELLKLLNRRPMVYEDYVELEYLPGTDNTGRLVDAYARICRTLLADVRATSYFERLSAGGHDVLVDDVRQEELLRGLGRKLADFPNSERESNHRWIEEEFLFPRVVVREAPPDPTPDPGAGDPVADPPPVVPVDPFSEEVGPVPEDEPEPGAVPTEGPGVATDPAGKGEAARSPR